MQDIPFKNADYELWLQFSGTQAAISQARQKKVGRYVHHNQAAALVIIWREEGMATPGFVSKALFLKNHSVSELLTRLEKKGLIEKTRDKIQGNIVRLSITPKGKEYCTRVTQADFIIRVMSSLSEEQKQQLQEILHTLINSVRAETES